MRRRKIPLPKTFDSKAIVSPAWRRFMTWRDADSATTGEAAGRAVWQMRVEQRQGREEKEH